MSKKVFVLKRFTPYMGKKKSIIAFVISLVGRFRRS